MLLAGGPLLLHNSLVDTAHSVNLAWLGSDYFLLLEFAEQLRFHRDAGTEDRKTTDLATIDFIDDGFQEVDERNWSNLSQFSGANLRRKRGDGGDLCPSVG